MKTAVQTFYYKHNRLQQLRGFCFAAQYGSIVRAAEQMGLTHSSVSLQIKALEKDMGCTLFTRHGPKITLTSDGARLMDIAQPLVDGIQSLHAQFHHETNVKINTELHIAVNSTAKNYLMPAIVSDYITHYPDIRIILHLAEHHEAVEMIREGKVDMAVLPRREQLSFPKYCEYTPIFHCKPCLISLPDHPLAGRKNLSISEINQYPITLPSEELQVIPGLHAIFGTQANDAKLRVAFVNTETGREYIESGLLITISSDIWIREKDKLVATSLSHMFPDMDYGMVQKSSKIMPEKTKHFLEIAHKHALKLKKSKPSFVH